MTIDDVITALLASTDKGQGPQPDQLGALVLEEQGQVTFDSQGPAVSIRCVIGRQDAGGYQIEAEGETWAEALRRWRR